MTGAGPKSSPETNQRYACCRHCVPTHHAHPGGRDEHPKPCGPWCSESVPVDVCCECGRQAPLAELDDVNAARVNGPRPEYVCSGCKEPTLFD